MLQVALDPARTLSTEEMLRALDEGVRQSGALGSERSLTK
jgi:hypothetical protein